MASHKKNLLLSVQEKERIFLLITRHVFASLMPSVVV